jgi:RNA polymerase sigma-70 factor, ECF subfamily
MAVLTPLVAGGMVVADPSTNETASCELFEVYGPDLYNMMVRSGADATTATKLVKVAVLSVWGEAGSAQINNTAVRTLMFTVARNLRTVHLHGSRSWQAPSAERMPALSPVMEPINQPPNYKPQTRKPQTRMQAAVNDLAPEQRQIVELAYLEGLSNRQIAERLSITVSCVKSSMRLTSRTVREAREDPS